MCYSAQASFLAAASLVPMGGYCLNSAFKRHRQFWPIAAVPLVFAFQQAMEGVIWTSLDHHHQEHAEMAARFYLFFALAWWPFWGPFTAWVASKDKLWKPIFGAWTVIATGWFLMAYLPALADSQNRVQATVVHHSIHYTYSDEVVLAGGNRIPVTILYLLFTGGPIMIVRKTMIGLPIVFAITSVVACHFFFSQAYTSTWCISAAILSSFCMVFFRHLDKQKQISDERAQQQMPFLGNQEKIQTAVVVIPISGSPGV